MILEDFKTELKKAFGNSSSTVKPVEQINEYLIQCQLKDDYIQMCGQLAEYDRDRNINTTKSRTERNKIVKGFTAHVNLINIEHIKPEKRNEFIDIATPKKVVKKAIPNEYESPSLDSSIGLNISNEDTILDKIKLFFMKNNLILKKIAALFVIGLISFFYFNSLNKKETIAILLPLSSDKYDVSIEAEKQLTGIKQFLIEDAKMRDANGDSTSIYNDFQFNIFDHKQDPAVAESIAKSEYNKGTRYFISTMTNVSISLAKYLDKEKNATLVCTTTSYFGKEFSTKANKLYRLYIRSDKETEELVNTTSINKDSSIVCVIGDFGDESLSKADKYALNSRENFKEALKKKGILKVNVIDIHKEDINQATNEILENREDKIKKSNVVFVAAYSVGAKEVLFYLKNKPELTKNKIILVTSTLGEEFKANEFEKVLENTQTDINSILNPFNIDSKDLTNNKPKLSKIKTDLEKINRTLSTEIVKSYKQLPYSFCKPTFTKAESDLRIDFTKITLMCLTNALRNYKNANMIDRYIKGYDFDYYWHKSLDVIIEEMKKNDSKLDNEFIKIDGADVIVKLNCRR